MSARSVYVLLVVFGELLLIPLCSYSPHERCRFLGDRRVDVDPRSQLEAGFLPMVFTASRPGYGFRINGSICASML